jgi:hypothetical protein
LLKCVFCPKNGYYKSNVKIKPLEPTVNGS